MESEEDFDSDLDSQDGSEWEDDIEPVVAQADAVRYRINPAYFTASSQLTALEYNDGLPRSLLGQLFDNRRLPQLAVLKVVFMDEQADMDKYGLPTALYWGFSCIPVCCPALRQLHLCNIMCSGSHLSDFTPLKGSLTSLTIAGDNSAAREVAKLTALKSLVWCLQPLTSCRVLNGRIRFDMIGRSALSNTGLLQLTALLQLTELTLEGWELCGGSLVRADNPDCDVAILRSSQEATRPDVWKQLKQLVPEPHPSLAGRQSCVVS